MSDDPTVLTAIDIRRLLELLPHRYPFLMVDRIVDISGDDYGVGIKNVTANEPHFQGHFPEVPVMPGVLLIEGMAQTAGAICLQAMESRKAPRFVYFMSIDKAKFRKVVQPGDTVQHRMRKLRHRGNIWRYGGESWVGDSMVAEAEVTAMMPQE